MEKKPSSGKAPLASYEWFRQARYGMFVHYGLYSILGRHEWALCYERIPFDEYRALADRFRPDRLNMREWVKLAADAGMRYMCLTTKHHEGFTLFDSKVSSFSATAVAGRDLVREYVDACREANMGVGLYYSVAEWGNADCLCGPRKDPRAWKRFVDKVHAELVQLMSDYGRVDYLFYDGCPPAETWNGLEINREIRRLQPHILISSRCGLDEDVISAEGHTLSDPGSCWETCMTTNESWGYNHGGDRSWKTPRQIVMQLMTCAHNGGNYLLNVGPKGDGSMPAQAVSLLGEVGAWVKRHGAAIYDTAAHPFDYADQKLSTAHGHRAFFALPNYHGPETVIAGIGNTVLSAGILSEEGREIPFKQDGNRVFLTGLPREEFDPLLTVVYLDLDAPPRGVPHPLVGGASYD